MSQARCRPPGHARRSSIRTAAAVLAAMSALCLASGCGGQSGDGTVPAFAGDGFDGARAFADLREQVELGPRPAGSAANRRSARRSAAELRRAGVEDVRIQHPERNVVGVIPGRGSGYVLIGAHYDTKPGIPGFVGANDGASGVAVILELARALPDPMPGPSIAIALFDGEEARGDRDFSADGKRGSTQYVDDARSGAMGSVPLARIKAMVLFDMVGDCDLHVPLEAASDPGLYARFAAAAPTIFSGESAGVDDDHTPFLEAGIPAVDLIDFSYGPGEPPGDYWHTAADTLDEVCPESLDAIGGAALEVLPQIDGP
jgi:hypothetical protein